MRYKFLILILVLFSKGSIFSQEKYIKHTVAKGETVSKIAEQYKIKSSAIYEINPDAKKGIHFKEILLVPVGSTNDKKVVAETSKSDLPQKEHLVLAKETLYGIAKQYGVKVVDLNNLNPGLEKRGLRVGSTINVPVTETTTLVIDNASSSDKTVVTKTEVKEIKEVVQPKIVEVVTEKKDTIATAVDSNKNQLKEILPNETLYGIARQYGVTVAELNSLNPGLEKRGLRVGAVINVPVANNLTVESSSKNEVIKTEEKVEEKGKTVEEKVVDKKDVLVALTIDSNGNQIKEVLPKETLYGIARDYGVTVADLEKVNPVLTNQSLRIGQKLIIPIISSQAASNDNIVAVNENVKESVINGTVAPAVVETKSTVPALSETISTPLVTEKAKTEEVSEVEITHEVQAKETKYGIAKEFGLTVKELEEQNPKIVNRLLVGEKLVIRTSKANAKTAVTPKNYFSEAALSAESEYDVKSFHGTDFIDQLISTASENIGVRYRTGGMSKDGFDCSGLICNTFGAFDIQLPRTSFEQSQFGEKVNTEDAKKGDLIFFKTNGRSQINHVGMVVEVCDGDIKFIHASVGNGVIISSTKEQYYSKRLTQINRVKL